MIYLHQLLEYYRNLDSATRLRGGIVIAACLALLVVLTGVNAKIGQMDKQRVRREKDVAEMMVLKQAYQTANAGAQKLANRMAATKPDDSPAKIIDEIGIKGKGVTVRSVKGTDQPGMVEDAADVRIDGLTANEAVNVLHRLEKGDKPVVIKKALLKTRFDDPSRIDLTMTIALLKAAPQTPR